MEDHTPPMLCPSSETSASIEEEYDDGDCCDSVHEIEHEHEHDDHDMSKSNQSREVQKNQWYMNISWKLG